VSVVRPPALTEDDLGPVGWHELHEAAKLYGRPSKAVLPLLLWALYQRHLGRDVELTRRQRAVLFAQVEAVA
jgi:hypothetical protein